LPFFSAEMVYSAAIFAEKLGVGRPVWSGCARLRLWGAACGLYQSYRPAFQKTGRHCWFSVAIFGLCMVLFPFSDSFILSLLVLAVTAERTMSGGDPASILQAMTPDICGEGLVGERTFIGSSNEIGLLNREWPPN